MGGGVFDRENPRYVGAGEPLALRHQIGVQQRGGKRPNLTIAIASSGRARARLARLARSSTPIEEEFVDYVSVGWNLGFCY
jgi:hypothetical protein